jgi:3-phenylpropionate/trans-cinnamate dioxygenase ferredoxin reductase subunit
MSDAVVIVGGGHAAAQLCASLAEAGWGPRVQLVCEESPLPYQRPPLSKAYLKKADEPVQPIRAQSWYEQAGITVHSADPVVTIDRPSKQVSLRSGKVLSYGHLVLATGTRARQLSALPASTLNVASLRTAEDAQRLRSRWADAATLTVIGGGYIGLELAATARALGKSVRVLESASRLLARSLSAEMADHVLQTHRAAGIDIQLGVKVDGFELQADRLVSLQVNGVREPVDLLVLGIGAEPELALARAAGLECDNGVVVDAFMQTSDPAVLAMGDCTYFPMAGTDRRLRLESVQNANDQARTVAATLQGRREPYKALPWFWSEQGSMRLQMAGLMPADGERVVRPGAQAGSFSVLHYVGDTMRCVESVNAPMDHMASRKLLELGVSPTRAQAADGSVPLKQWIPV